MTIAAIPADSLSIPPADTARDAWSALTLVNAGALWTDTTNFYPPGWWKDPYGIVHLRGLVGRTNSVRVPVAQAPESAIETGMRFSAWSSVGYIHVLVGGDGSVSLERVNAAESAIQWASLDGITYPGVVPFLGSTLSTQPSSGLLDVRNPSAYTSGSDWSVTMWGDQAGRWSNSFGEATFREDPMGRMFGRKALSLAAGQGGRSDEPIADISMSGYVQNGRRAFIVPAVQSLGLRSAFRLDVIPRLANGNVQVAQLNVFEPAPDAGGSWAMDLWQVRMTNRRAGAIPFGAFPSDVRPGVNGKSLRDQVPVALTAVNGTNGNIPPYLPAQAQRDAFGVVSLEGLVQLAAVAGGGGLVVAILPAGYRPTRIHIYTVYSTWLGFAQVRVYPNGDVQVLDVPSGTYISLEAISFRTD
jgi:hypothetical protein